MSEPTHNTHVGPATDVDASVVDDLEPDDVAVSMWVEQREDGIAELCYDTQAARTHSVALTQSAAGDLVTALRDGPTGRPPEASDGE